MDKTDFLKEKAHSPRNPGLKPANRANPPVVNYPLPADPIYDVYPIRNRRFSSIRARLHASGPQEDVE